MKSVSVDRPVSGPGVMSGVSAATVSDVAEEAIGIESGTSDTFVG